MILPARLACYWPDHAASQLGQLDSPTGHTPTSALGSKNINTPLTVFRLLLDMSIVP
jgi:hypothetical protein